MTTEPASPIPGQPVPASTQTPAAAHAAEPAQPPAGEQAVPYQRFKEVNDRLRAAEDAARELQEWKAEQERAALSETERLTQERDQALQRAEQAEGKVTRLERGQLVATAAAAAGFADPQDAAAFIDLSAIEDQAAARTAVQQLAESKPHLVKQQPGAPERPAPIGGLTGAQPAVEVPVGQDGKPDAKLGLGRDLLASLSSKR